MTGRRDVGHEGTPLRLGIPQHSMSHRPDRLFRPVRTDAGLVHAIRHRGGEGEILRGQTTFGGTAVRIAHLTTVDMSLALLLATELDEDLRAGHAVLGISASGPYVERVEELGVEHVAVVSLTRSWSPGRDFRAFAELVRTLRRLKLDVLHTHTPKAGVMGRIAGRLTRVPVVVNTCHGLWACPDDPVSKRAFVYGLEALAIRFSDYELFQNAEDAHTMRRFLKPDRWKVVGNGIDLERFRPDPEGRTRIRAEWGISDDQIVVGTIGRRVREKGLAEFAQAAHRLGDKAAFVWVGPEDNTDAAAQVPDQDAIRFVGEYSDMPAVYSALDVFALASYREGFSRASMEAAACGLPMVLSDIRGCRELGTHDEHLLLVTPQDSTALTHGIQRLLNEPGLRSRLGDAAHRRALAEFDQRKVAQESLNAYAIVAGRGDPLPAGVREPANVLHVLPQDQSRGGQVFAGQLRDALRGDETQRHLVVTLFDGLDAGAHADRKLGVKGGILRKAGLDPRAVVRLFRLIRAEKPALVVAHGGEALKYVVPAAAGTRTVYYKIGLSSGEIARPLHRGLYRWLSRRVTHVVGVSDAVTDQVAELFDIPRDRLSTLPNGRDHGAFPAASSAAVPAVPSRVLFVGNLEGGKRPDLFLDVIAELRRQGIGHSAAIVGDGPQRSALDERASALGVEVLGIRDDVPRLLRESAVLVMTSSPDTEGMPGVLIEAGMSGIPVVTTAAAGARDVVDDGVTGFVVASERAEALAARVGELLQDPALRSRMGQAARARCIQLFSLEALAQRWHELVAELTEPDNEPQVSSRVEVAVS